MFVASLNLDLFFKKVFSDKRIAKQFLEDVLHVQIKEIKLLATDHKISDDSVLIKFDFRCKINGKYVVIEMQQRHKMDVNKRFYLYHCVGTALQLEALEPISVTKSNGDTYKEKNYGDLEPVITLIWMADDTLKFEMDMVGYATLPEVTKSFITNEQLWTQPLEVIKQSRKEALKILNNKTKDLDFFSQNRLIYLFQKNIVRNKTMEEYFKWFDFAEKSKNPHNVESDFEHLKNDAYMAELIKRLQKDSLSPDEVSYLANLPDYEGEILIEMKLRERERDKTWMEKLARQKKRSDRAKQLLKKEQEAKIRAELDKAQAEQAKVQAEQLKKQAEQAKAQAEQTLQAKMLISVKALLMLEKDIETIADILELSIEEVADLVKQIQHKG